MRLSESIRPIPSMQSTLDIVESVKDFKMDLKIENDTATIKYDYNIDNFIKTFCTFTTDAKGKMKNSKTQYDGHESLAADFKIQS